MIQNKEAAKHIIDVLQKCAAELNESVKYVQETCSEDEFKAYRRAAGHIMGEIYDQGFEPLFKEHPELEPEGFK